MTSLLALKKSPEKNPMGSSSRKVYQDNQINKKLALFTAEDTSINQNEALARGSMNEFKDLLQEVKEISDNLCTNRVDTKNVVIAVKNLSYALLEVKNTNSENLKKLEERVESINIIELRLANKIDTLESNVKSMERVIITKFGELQKQVDHLMAIIHDQSRFISEEPSHNEVADKSNNENPMSTWKGDEKTSENLRMRKKVFSENPSDDST